MKLTKTRLLIGLLIVNMFVWGANSAFANINCGLKPLKPLGCGMNSYAVCQCDANGKCTWVWMNC